MNNNAKKEECQLTFNNECAAVELNTTSEKIAARYSITEVGDYDDQFLNVKQVSMMCGCCPSSIFQMVQTKSFPTMFKVGGSKRSRWSKREVIAWMVSQMNGRE